MTKHVVWETVETTERRTVPVRKRVRTKEGTVRDALVFEVRDVPVKKQIKKIVEDEG